MSLTVTKRPIGHKLNSVDVDAQIIDDGQGNALVYTTSAHGLSDGDYVYIESDLEGYNGFVYVDSIQYDSFKIKESEDGDYIAYEQDADISYRTSILNHGWQCVHLPIVYEIESDLYPNNIAEEAYTPNVIDSFENVGGYVQLNLSAGIAGLEALNYIEIVGDGELAGPYQVVSVANTWAPVIRLAYDASYNFSGYQVVYYYNNYNVNVEVWAGLSPTHRWFNKKPFELATTLKFIPDSEGKVKFSINEILKGYIETRNNLLLNTLPNNLDFHVAFYIKYYESYDDSTGASIFIEYGPTTTDDFEGRAVNAMLPFKTLTSGHMSDYLNEDTDLARWLTLFDRPIAVVDRFFDISFLNQYDNTDIAIYRNGELFMTIENPGSGVIRVPFIPETGFTEYCLQAYRAGGTESVSLASWVNNPGSGANWTLGATPSVTVSFPIPPISSDTIYGNYVFVDGVEYTVEIDYDNGGIGNSSLRILDDDLNTIESHSQNVTGGGTSSINFTATDEMTKIGFGVTGVGTITISNLRVTSTASPITERICIDIIEECSGTFLNDNLRLLESNQLRELE